MKAANSEVDPAAANKDVLGLVTVSLPVVFYLMLLANSYGLIDIVDPEYMEHGFSVATYEVQGFHSFLLCFIVDTLATILLLLTARGRREWLQVMTIFVHGFFHLFQYITGQIQGTGHGVADYFTLIAFTSVNLAGFGLGTKLGTTRHLVAGTIVLASAQTQIPAPYVFAFVNLWITLVIAAASRVSPRKLHPWARASFLLFGFVPFFEAITCQGYKSLGGHVIFDAAAALVTAAGILGEVEEASPKATKQK